MVGRHRATTIARVHPRRTEGRTWAGKEEAVFSGEPIGLGDAAWLHVTARARCGTADRKDRAGSDGHDLPASCGNLSCIFLQRKLSRLDRVINASHPFQCLVLQLASLTVAPVTSSSLCPNGRSAKLLL